MLVFHSPSFIPDASRGVSYGQRVDKVLALVPPVPAVPRLVVLSVSDNPVRSWPLLASAAQRNISVRLLQPAAKLSWPDNLGPKNHLALEAVRAISDPQQLVLIVDAFDTLITASANTIVDSFETLMCAARCPSHCPARRT